MKCPWSATLTGVLVVTVGLWFCPRSTWADPIPPPRLVPEQKRLFETCLIGEGRSDERSKFHNTPISLPKGTARLEYVVVEASSTKSKSPISTLRILIVTVEGEREIIEKYHSVLQAVVSANGVEGACELATLARAMKNGPRQKLKIVSEFAGFHERHITLSALLDDNELTRVLAVNPSDVASVGELDQVKCYIHRKLTSAR